MLENIIALCGELCIYMYSHTVYNTRTHRKFIWADVIQFLLRGVQISDFFIFLPFFLSLFRLNRCLTLRQWNWFKMKSALVTGCENRWGGANTMIGKEMKHVVKFSKWNFNEIRVTDTCKLCYTNFTVRFIFLEHFTILLSARKCML